MQGWPSVSLFEIRSAEISIQGYRKPPGQAGVIDPRCLKDLGHRTQVWRRSLGLTTSHLVQPPLPLRRCFHTFLQLVIATG